MLHAILKKHIIFLFLMLTLSACGIPNYSAKEVVEALKGIPLQSNTLKHKQDDFHYTLLENTDSDSLVVFVHGSPGGWEAYGDYLADQDLRKHATLISVDRLGFGGSQNSGFEASLNAHASAISAAIKAETRKNTIIVGHSYGGPVAARLAMDFPELIDGIILLAPSISPEQEKRRWYNVVGSWRIIQWFLPSALVTSNREIYQLKGELIDMLPLWKNIHVPAVVIQGEDDKLVPKENADFAQKVLTNAPVKIIRLKNQGHFIVWDQYSLVKKEIIDMLKTIQ